MKMNTLILLLVIFASASFAQESSYLPNPYLEVPLSSEPKYKWQTKRNYPTIAWRR